MPQCRRCHGFAVRELAVVLLVILLATGVVAQRLAALRLEVAKTACEQNAVEINLAIGRWYLHKGGWPADDLSDISQDLHYFPSGLPRCAVTGEPYRMDPYTHRVLRHRH